MAVTKRYYAKWKQPNREFQRFLYVYDLENTAFGWGFSSNDPKQLTIASGGLNLQYEGRTDNVFDPIKSSSLKVNLIIQNDDQAKILEAIRETTEFNIGVTYGFIDEVEVGGVTYLNEIVEWRGVVAPQSVQVDYGIDPYAVSFTAVDGLSLLAEQSYRAPNGAQYDDHATLQTHMARCFQYLPTLPLFGTPDVVFSYITDIYHDNHDINANQVGYDVGPLSRTGCNSGTFLTEAERPNIFENLFLVKRKTLSCLDVLKDIMIAFQLTMSMSEGRFYCVSALPYLADPEFYGKYQYGLSKNNLSSPGITSNYGPTEINQGSYIDSDSNYDILVGSKESVLPPASTVTYVHRNGGSTRVFPRAQTHVIDANFRDPVITGIPRPNLGDFQGDQEGARLGDFPKNNAEIEIPQGTGFRIRGIFRMRVRSPKNDSLNVIGDPVSRADEMIGAKIICSMQIQVGSYYLKQTATQLSASDFTDETDWGEIQIPYLAVGANSYTNRFYYPIQHSDAEWTTNSADRFEFMVLHPEFTQPAVETIEYDDENGEVTTYPVGLFLKRQPDSVNKTIYNNESHQEWMGESSNGILIDWLESNPIGLAGNDYPNPVISTDIDLQIPALPDVAGDQVGITIDCSVKGYTAEGFILYDTDVSAWPNPSSNYSWLGNVLIDPPTWTDFEFYLGDASRSEDTMFSSQDDDPNGSESLLLGTTLLGSRYNELFGALGYLHVGVYDPNTNEWPTGSYSSQWDSLHETQAANKGILQVAANVGMSYYGEARRQFDLILKPRPGSSRNRVISPRNIFDFTRESMRLIVQRVDIDLESGIINMTGVELEHDPRVITELNTTGNKGLNLDGGGIPPVPGGVVRSQRIFGEERFLGRSLKPEQVTKLDFINVNAAGTGVDTITGFTGGGGSVSASDQLKLDAITMNANGDQIADFDVDASSEPLSSDEVDDSTAAHKFVTQGQINDIASTSASVSDILAVFKNSTTSDGAGVYINTSATDESHVSVTGTTGKLQAGARTNIDLSETSPGQVDINVQSGTAGSEVQTTAISVAGSSSSPLPTTTINSLVNHGRDWNFTNASSTVTFTAGTSGIDYGDLDNPPTTITAAERAKLSGLTKYHGVLLDGASGGTGIGSGTISMAVGDRFACKGTVASDGFYEVTTAFTWTQGATETDGQLEFNAEFNNFQVVASAADIGLADLAASSATDAFNDSLASFSLTTSAATTFQALIVLFQGNTAVFGNFSVTGNITLTGTVDGIDIATDVSANTAKVSFPGFGTTSGTALEGNTAIPSATSDLTNDLGFITSANELDGVYLEVKTRTAAYVSGAHEGQVVKFGTGTLTAGKVYVLRDNSGTGLWEEADADAEIQTKGLFGMALGTSPTTDGLLVRGIRSFSNSFTVGAPLYISLTAGELTDDLSSHTTGDFVRAVGYSLSTQLIYLDPSPDFIELG